MLSVGPKLRLLLLLSCMTLVILLQVSDAKRDLKTACSTCRQITDNFDKVTDPLLIYHVFLFYRQDASVSGCLECLMMLLYLCFTSDFIFCLRALKEQQSRTLVEATRPGRRGNCPNMRQGETVQPGQSKLQVTKTQNLVREPCLLCTKLQSLFHLHKWVGV